MTRHVHYFAHVAGLAMLSMSNLSNAAKNDSSVVSACYYLVSAELEIYEGKPNDPAVTMQALAYRKDAQDTLESNRAIFSRTEKKFALADRAAKGVFEKNKGLFHEAQRRADYRTEQLIQKGHVALAWQMLKDEAMPKINAINQLCDDEITRIKAEKD